MMCRVPSSCIARWLSFRTCLSDADNQAIFGLLWNAMPDSMQHSMIFVPCDDVMEVGLCLDLRLTGHTV